jgi:hypothetical protein
LAGERLLESHVLLGRSGMEPRDQIWWWKLVHFDELRLKPEILSRIETTHCAGYVFMSL